MQHYFTVVAIVSERFWAPAQVTYENRQSSILLTAHDLEDMRGAQNSTRWENGSQAIKTNQNLSHCVEMNFLFCIALRPNKYISKEICVNWRRSLVQLCTQYKVNFASYRIKAKSAFI